MRNLVIVAQEVADSRKSVMSALKPLYEEGYVLLSCMSGEDVFQKLSLGSPKLLIIDLSMPEFNGFQIINKIKSNPQTANIPILVLTSPSIGLFKYLTRCLEVKFFFYRPASAAKLLEMARTCMEAAQ